ncbi:helix-turn-helix domain-containing protein [Akkermansiaceae bacterium]|jgi:hypothetical protein|nr:helix-turn-helix domain-containing protein [Akkermansiaceae bacterium]MDB4465200.1 helix-turn-helix domain-containing protein [Akkermansiaceae bacterium]MDB4509700.1 helix-turn-helix domain-containing protein [Akkermansiaceae bacterium]MDF1714415.1 hypothetical protein [Akkermansiaceae bacterium]
MSKSQFTISEINRITGKSRTTITKHIKEGKLSAIHSGDQKLVDAAELIRVYGDECNFEKASSAQNHSTVQPKITSQNKEAPHLQLELEKERQERERERRHFIDQIENLQDSLKTAQEGHNRATLLLENHSGGGAFQEALEGLSKRLDQQELTLKEEAELTLRLKKQNRVLKRAVMAERQKSVWEKIFGTSRAASPRPANR